MQCNQRLENQNQWSVLKPVLKTVYANSQNRTVANILQLQQFVEHMEQLDSKLRLQRPVTGPVTQISKEFLEN